jgi:hypothetical protein
VRHQRKTPRIPNAYQSGPLPTEARIVAHRTVLDALAALRVAYRAVTDDSSSTADAREAIRRAGDLLASIPAPHSVRTDPTAARVLEIADGLPPAQLRWQILEASTELLAVSRDLTRGGSPSQVGDGV